MSIITELLSSRRAEKATSATEILHGFARRLARGGTPTVEDASAIDDALRACGKEDHDFQDMIGLVQEFDRLEKSAADHAKHAEAATALQAEIEKEGAALNAAFERHNTKVQEAYAAAQRVAQDRNDTLRLASLRERCAALLGLTS